MSVFSEGLFYGKYVFFISATETNIEELYLWKRIFSDLYINTVL